MEHLEQKSNSTTDSPIRVIAKKDYSKDNFTELIQVSENDTAMYVLLHKPSSEMLSSALHPIASLFEKPTNIQMAKEAHNNFKEMLHKYGIKTLTLHSIIKEALKNDESKQHLISLMNQFLRYILVDKDNKEITDPVALFNTHNKKYLEDSYKMQVLSKLSYKELIAIILTQPKVFLKASHQPTDFQLENLSITPMGNLIFTRDQQIITARGPVLGRMSTVQRQNEVVIIKLIYSLLHVKFSELPDDTPDKKYRLEGGDYVTDDDIAFIGVGPRTTIHSIDFMVQNDLFYKEKVAVVIDDKDLNQDRMHLDTVFNIVSKNVAVILEDITNGTYPGRHVNECTRVLDKQGNFVRYDQTVVKQPFLEYLKNNNYKLIHVTDQEQKEYMINFLNIGENRIISVHENLKDKLELNGVTDVNVEYMEYVGIKNMYGAAHCSSQVFRKGSKIYFDNPKVESNKHHFVQRFDFTQHGMVGDQIDKKIKK